ncbi:MAG: T9SS type A sorting domain-containing protein, partial [Balneolaceae bacterium]
KMYWVITGAVMRANLDGTEVEVVTEITSYVQPQGIEVNTESGHVYWTDSSSEEIMRAPIDGSNVESIINADSPSALSLDADNGKLYWVEDYTFSGGGGAIYRANTDGSEIEIVRELSWTRSALFVSGWDMATSSEEESFSDLPKEVILESNYPNPFNPQTIIQYQLPEAMAVKLTVYNFLGQNVHSLLNGEMQTSGAHRVVFDAENLPSGTYFYRLETEAGSVTGKMTLIK